MSFFDLENYTISDIQDIINQGLEESVHLDYKACESLHCSDGKKREITKDVSSFANSDGGIIIYGITEEEHKPKDFSFVDGNTYTKEWLENVITSIRPRISGIRIFPIRNNEDVSQTIYVVKIPRSEEAPHMALDYKYYKRYNFKSVPMEDYEVKDTIHRVKHPELQIVNCSLQEDSTISNKGTSFAFKAWIKNVGKTVSKDYKLSATFFNFPSDIKYNYQPAEGKVLSMYICDYCFRISSPSKESLFPGEIIETGHYHFEIPTDMISELQDKAYVKMTLHYENGGKDEMLTNIKHGGEFGLFDHTEINDYIKNDHPDFELIEII